MQERRIQIVPQPRYTLQWQSLKQRSHSVQEQGYVFPIWAFTVLDCQSELGGHSQYETSGGGEIEF